VRGASALQQVLSEHSDLPLRTFVVWESVLPTDVLPPSSKKLAIIADERAVQYWDPKLSLADEILRAVLAHPERYPSVPGAGPVTEDTIVWDVVLLFPPGATWTDGPPVPTVLGAPVLLAVEELDAALDALQP
jgi:hypothetical protein